MKSKYINFFLIFTALAIVISGFVYEFNIPYRNSTYNKDLEKPRTLDKDVKFKDYSGKESIIKFPLLVKNRRTDTKGSLEFEFDIRAYDLEIDEGNFLLFETEYADVKVFFGNILSYQSYFDDYKKRKNELKKIHLVEFPKTISAKTIKIIYKKKIITQNEEVLQAPLISNKSNLVTHKLSKDFLNLTLSFILLIFFFINTSAYIISFKNKIIDENLVSISFFALICSMYIISRSFTIRYFLADKFFISVISYSSKALLLTPILAFLKNKVNPSLKKIYNAFILGMIILTIVQAIVISTTSLNFSQFEKIIEITLFVQILLVFVGIIMGNKKEKTEIKNFIFCILPFLIMYTFSYFALFLGQGIKSDTILILLLCYFALSESYFIYKLYLKNYGDKSNLEFYRRLAYVDPLSNAESRLAFEEKIKELKKKSTLKGNILVASFDMNGLKEINDLYGHQEGDRYIERMGKILKDAFKSCKKTHIYRIGGDEFVAISQNVQENSIAKLKANLIDASNRISEVSYFNISFAMGFALSEKGEKLKIKELLKLADKKMYEDKRNKE